MLWKDIALQSVLYRQKCLLHRTQYQLSISSGGTIFSFMNENVIFVYCHLLCIYERVRYTNGSAILHIHSKRPYQETNQHHYGFETRAALYNPVASTEINMYCLDTKKPQKPQLTNTVTTCTTTSIKHTYQAPVIGILDHTSIIHQTMHYNIWSLIQC